MYCGFSNDMHYIIRDSRIGVKLLEILTFYSYSKFFLNYYTVLSTGRKLYIP
jgi:hypothetical protein